MEQRIIAGILDRVEGALELYADRRVSLTILHVNLERQTSDMQVFDPEAARALAGFRDRVVHIGAISTRAWLDILDVKRDFRAWRRRYDTGAPETPMLRIVPDVDVDDDALALRAALSEVETITREVEPIFFPDELIEEPTH